MRYIIGLDLGTNSVKALLLKGTEILGSRSVSYTPDYPEAGFVEQDPQVWWDAAYEAIKNCITAFPEARGQVTAIAASGQMHSSVFLDSTGRVIRKAILWNDTRTSAEIEEIYAATGGKAKMLEYVSNRALEGFTLPKILWLRRHEPENFALVSQVIMPKDYINYKLTGRVATEVSDAAGTVLFDVKQNTWSEPLLNRLKLDKSILPEVLNSTDTVGTVLPGLAEELGLSNDTSRHVQVIAGGADNSCAGLGNGLTERGQTVVSIGTSGTVVTVLDKVEGRITGDVHLFNYSYPGKYYAMGCMLCAGESLEWLKTIIPVASFDEFNAMAEKSPAGSRGLVFLPYLFGERCPVADPNARGIFFGLSSQTGRNELVRSVMEGVAFNIRAMFELVLAFTPVKDVYITGGGAKSRIWGQILADVLNTELKVLNMEEGPALGAALIAGVGSGSFESFEAAKKKILKVTRVITPHEEPAYERNYRLFLQIYDANRKLFAER
jgi:xylulokinase